MASGWPGQGHGPLFSTAVVIAVDPRLGIALEGYNGDHSRPPRRSILLGGLVAAAGSFLVGMAAVTGVELGVGKSLSCWVWEDWRAQSAGRGAASVATTRTRLSLLWGS